MRMLQLPVLRPVNPLIINPCRGTLLALALLIWAAPCATAREKDGVQYGAGLIVNLPFAEADVTQSVKDIIQNGIIRGSKEYEREEYITGAEEATSVAGFPEWQDQGKVFYKVRTHALDPRNFKQSGDVGTLAVRYIVQAQGSKNTVLRIDAIFVEDFRRTVHPSNGSVEGAEYKTIHDYLEKLESMRQLSREAGHSGASVSQKLMARDTVPALPAPASTSAGPAVKTVPSQPTSEPANVTPEQHLKNLRHEVERIVKSPGAPLKASPFQSAKTLVSLPSGTEVLLVISTPYWYGVETHSGQHGWLARDQVEFLP